MPVHFTVATHESKPVKSPYNPVNTPEQLLHETWGIKSRTTRCAELLQHSLGDRDFSSVLPERNGFVDTIMRAYNHHHHLVIRPDDVWIAILGQFNFYVNAHAEELRAHFVQHEGKKQLTVNAYGTRYTVNFGDLARQMTGEIQKNVIDEQLKDWILPDYTTTTANDTVVCAVLMMATLKAYFDFKFCLMCGIPSVTLEGEKSDWEKLLARTDKLHSFGPEPTAWAALLRPILQRFANAFDGEPDVDFWSRVCHCQSFGSGPTYLSGWITAFCVWSSEGKWQGPPLSGANPSSEKRQLTLDGVLYPTIDSNDIPIGFCEVDVKLNDNGEEFECMMVSGLIAGLVEGKGKDTVRPLSSWFMFNVSDARGSVHSGSVWNRSSISAPKPASVRFGIGSV